MDTSVFIELHKASINIDHIFVNVYETKYLKQYDLEQYMCKSNVSKVKINYGSKLTIEYNWDISRNKIMITANDLSSLHILRLVKIRLRENIRRLGLVEQYEIKLEILYDFLSELNCLLTDSFYDFCTVCGSNITIKGLGKISICSKPKCKKWVSQIPIDDKLSRMLEYDPKIFELLPTLLASSFSHPKASALYTDIPALPDVYTFEEYKAYATRWLNLGKIRALSSGLSEIDLVNSLGRELYSLVKVSVSDNYFSLNTQSHMSIPGIKLAKKMTDNLDADTIHLVKINYSAEIENKFNTGHYLYHGSPFHCWHSIIKNGLKVMSNTKFMTAGAKYGSGIYLSDDFQFSLEYSAHGNIGNMYTLGVFEILTHPSAYMKRTNIFVVPDEKVILLRYLIVISPYFTQGKTLNTYFNTSNYQNMYQGIRLRGSFIPQALGCPGCHGTLGRYCKICGSSSPIPTTPTTPTTPATQEYNIVRLNKEYELLLTNRIIISVTIIKTNCLWNISILNEKHGEIKLDIIFNDYPINAPTIKYISGPNIKTTTSNPVKILADNTIRMEETNPANWTITNNLSKLITTLNKYIIHI